MVSSKKYHAWLILVLIAALNITSSYAGLKDRAFATHNVNQLGYFTTNIGQFYPYGGQFEKTLEYPINSGHVAMYRQCLMVGVPVNVISAADGRFEEFDAVGGYNAGGGEIAISDNPATWPSWGWPVQDDQGNEIFLAQQESYCVYSDSTNWRYKNNGELDMLLDIRIHQTIYSWGVSGYEKFHILKFEIENAGASPLTDMYFNFYSDLDIGGNGNAEREWADDCLGLDRDREMVYFYDSDNYSDEWGEANPFPVGVSFLETPNDLGITDFHWIDVTIDEVAVNSAHWDSLSYYLMRSDTSYFHEHPQLAVSDFFHLGDNPIDGTHFDDPATTLIEDDDGNLIGGAMVAYICNGPIEIQPGESAVYYVAVAVGDDENDMFYYIDQAKDAYDKDFKLATIPEPEMTAAAGNNQNVLQWNNRLDVEYINQFAVPPSNDLDGYIIYRTTDQLLGGWTVLDTIPMEFKGETEIRENAYSYTDNSNVFNGFDYIYSLTAYSKAADGSILESNRLNDINNLDNSSAAAMLQPSSKPAEEKADVDEIKVVPNPFVLSAQWDAERLGNYRYGEPVRNIAFTNLPENCTIKIFTLDGDLVNTIRHSGTTGREEWNLLTSENRPIVSGIYFFHVKSKLGEKLGRFAVIR